MNVVTFSPCYYQNFMQQLYILIFFEYINHFKQYNKHVKLDL